MTRQSHRPQRISRRTAIALLCWLSFFQAMPRASAVPLPDGLYAKFTVRRGSAVQGEFTCRLEMALAPKTVANFVGLAEGSRAWVDFAQAGASRRPFYNGLTFHRVVSDFVIQGGSPNGRGNDGPGYTFPDEFHPSLRHARAGILSMANSGPNSNGSQFFVTLAATPWLNDVHSVFGEVTEGLNVVLAVKQGDVMDQVTIIRAGAAAVGFAAETHVLPRVADAQANLRRQNGTLLLEYSGVNHAEYFAQQSPNLLNWRPMGGRQLFVTAPAILGRDVTELAAAAAAPQFFAVTRVEYPEPIQTPASLVGRRITLSDTSGFVFTWDLTSESAGTYTSSMAPGTFPVSSYSWSQDPYRGRFSGAISGLALSGSPVTQATWSLAFTSPTGGQYRGALTTALGRQFGLAGSFTAADIPR